MDELKSITLLRRVWLLDRMEELRAELSGPEREELLTLLGAMTYSDWLSLFLKNCDIAVGYAASSKSDRKKARGKKSDSTLLVHHAAMFTTGLHEMARNLSFPEPYISKSERFHFEISAMVVAIKTWDDLETQVACSLFWQFDEPECSTMWPFKQE